MLLNHCPECPVFHFSEHCMNCISCTSETRISTIIQLITKFVDFMKKRIASSDVRLNVAFSTLYCNVNCHVSCCKCSLLADTCLQSLVDVFYSVITQAAGVTVVLKFLKFQNCPEIVLKLQIVLKF